MTDLEQYPVPTCDQELLAVCFALLTRLEKTIVVYGHGDSGDGLSYDEPLRQRAKQAIARAAGVTGRVVPTNEKPNG